MPRSAPIARPLILLVTVASAVRVLACVSRLPYPVAVHFDSAGTPNGWMPPPVFAAFHLGLLALLAAVFLGLPRMLRRLPARLINLPRREYWLAPERRDATMARLGDRLTWLGLAVIGFVAFGEELVLRANLEAGGRLDSSSLAIGLMAFLGYTAVWLVGLWRMFGARG